MATIAYPSGSGFPGFVSYTLKLTRKSIMMRSPYTGKRQTIGYPYALWSFSGKYSLADNPSGFAGALRAFFLQLEGMVNAFRLPIPEYTGPSTGYAGAAGLVNGASQSGLTLITDGWTAGAAIFKVGDYFNINDELKVITANATANGSGQVTLAFEPLIRVSPADNLALGITNPTILLCANSDEVASWDLLPPTLYQFQLDATESV